MKKKLLIVMAVSAVTIMAGYNVYNIQKDRPLSVLALANVEALAGYESPDFEVICGEEDGDCWVMSGECHVSWFITYDDCAFSGRMQDSCVTPCDD